MLRLSVLYAVYREREREREKEIERLSMGGGEQRQAAISPKNRHSERVRAVMFSLSLILLYLDFAA